MPEGHTVYRIARDHDRLFAGQKTAVLSPQGRFESEAGKLNGSKLIRVDSHGKHLFYHWSRNRVVHIHLGLYGKFRVHQNPPPEARGAVRLRVITGNRSFDLNGPNRCELMTPAGVQGILNRLGEDPLKENADPEKIWSRMRHGKRSIGAALLDQSLIAGIGNIYRAELLYLCQINPERRCDQVAREEFDRLWSWTVKLLRIGVENNRIITVLDDTAHGRSRNQRNRFHVYKQEKCQRCRRSLYYWESANRTIYACDHCQR